MSIEPFQHHSEVLNYARELVTERGPKYGTVEECFARAAQIASLRLNRAIHPYEIHVIMSSVKNARVAFNPGHLDSHVDIVNYEAFAATQMAGYVLLLAAREAAREAATRADVERRVDEHIANLPAQTCSVCESVLDTVKPAR